MKKRFGVALLAVPLLALPVCADDPFTPGLPFRVETGGNVYFRVLSRQNGWGCQLGPWYSYWPMEAHFQTPALPSYPFWPAPQAIVPGGTKTVLPAPYYPPPQPGPAPASAAPPSASPVKPAYYQQTGQQLYGYYGYQQDPVWSYGR
jgi:hypothetical protein